MLRLWIVCCIVLLGSPCGAAEPELIRHWPLREDAQDAIGQSSAPEIEAVTFEGVLQRSTPRETASGA